MLEAFFNEYNISHLEYEIVPLPINYPELFQYYVPMDAVFFLTIYDNWGRYKLNTFKSMELKTDVMWEATMEDRITTGKELRRMMIQDEDWEKWVPKSVAHYIQTNGLVDKIKKRNAIFNTIRV